MVVASSLDECEYKEGFSVVSANPPTTENHTLRLNKDLAKKLLEQSENIYHPFFDYLSSSHSSHTYIFYSPNRRRSGREALLLTSICAIFAGTYEFVKQSMNFASVHDDRTAFAKLASQWSEEYQGKVILTESLGQDLAKVDELIAATDEMICYSQKELQDRIFQIAIPTLLGGTLLAVAAVVASVQLAIAGGILVGVGLACRLYKLITESTPEALLAQRVKKAIQEVKSIFPSPIRCAAVVVGNESSVIA